VTDDLDKGFSEVVSGTLTNVIGLDCLDVPLEEFNFDKPYLVKYVKFVADTIHDLHGGLKFIELGNL